MMSQEIADVSFATDEDKSRDGGDGLQYFSPIKAIVNSYPMTNVTKKEQEVVTAEEGHQKIWDQEPAFFILWNTQTSADFIGINFAISKNKTKNLDKLSNPSVQNSIKNEVDYLILQLSTYLSPEEVKIGKLQSLTGVFRFRSMLLSDDPECDKINK